MSFDDDEIEIKGKFKFLAALTDMPMSRRVIGLIKMDLAYWKKYGKPMPLDAEFVPREKTDDDIPPLPPDNDQEMDVVTIFDEHQPILPKTPKSRRKER